MEFSNNKKMKLNILLLLVFVLIILFFSIFLKKVIINSSVENGVAQARQIIKQLLVTRDYLATLGTKIEIKDENQSDFALAPAKIGSHISKKLSQDTEIYLKQTSIQYRNSENAPDPYEVQILNQYGNKTISGEFWEMTQFKGQKALRYTYPLYITPNCMTCHGTPYKDVDSKTYDMLLKHYGNRSFDYKVGEIRGMISLVIPSTVFSNIINTIYSNVLFIILVLVILVLIYFKIENRLIYAPQIQEIESKSKESEKQKEYLETVIESNNNAIIAIDHTYTIKTYNKKAEELFGYTAQEMLNSKNLIRLIPAKHKKNHSMGMKNYFKTGRSAGLINSVVEIEAQKKDHTIFFVRISFGTNGKIDNRIVTANISDISLEKEQEKQLKEKSEAIKNSLQLLNKKHYFDTLTGLYSRNKLIEDLNIYETNSLLLIDINKFKNINDLYGNDIGDEVLNWFAKILKENADKNDLRLYRLSADEFTLLCNNLESANTCIEVAKHLLEEIKTRSIQIKKDLVDIEINLSISIGIAFKETKSMEKANMALVHASKSKSPFAIYSKSMKIEEEYEYDIKWSKIIKDAIDNDLVFPFFQPIVDKNGQKKFECLMRILKDGEYITPYYFLEIAKKAGFYPKLTKIMIEKSLKSFKDRPESFSINLGFEDISNTKLVDFLIQRITNYKISDRLIIELVETENISDFEIMKKIYQSNESH